MEKLRFIKCMNIIIISLILTLFFISFVNASVYNLCLTNGQTVKFSLCNPNIADRYCSKSTCQYCVSETNGVYCPMSPSNCYNAGDCHYLPNTTSEVIITITSLNPASSYNTTATSLTFSYKVTNSASVGSCNLYVNDIFLATNSSKIGSATNYIDVELEPGNYDWYLKCISKSGNTSNSTTRTLIIESDPLNPVNQTNISVSLLNPTNNTLILPGIIIFSYSVSDISNLNQCNFVANGNTLASTNSSSIIIGNNNFSVNLTNGSYNWNIGCIDKSLRTTESETRFLNVTNETVAPTPQPPADGGGGGGGGGGGSSGGGGSITVCSNKWECKEWGECIEGVQKRTCDYNRTRCKPGTPKPVENQSCEVQVSNISTNSTNETISSTPKSPIENLITGASIALNNPRILWASIIVIVICIVIGYFLLRKGKEPEEATKMNEEVKQVEEAKPTEKEKKGKKEK